MTAQVKLHHVAKRIMPGTLDTVVEMFETLGCKVTFRPPSGKWVMIGQSGLPFDLQIAEVNTPPVQGISKSESHIGFISNSPGLQIEAMQQWALACGQRIETGQWGEREFWFDFPDLFNDFVIEIMHTTVAEG